LAATSCSRETAGTRIDNADAVALSNLLTGPQLLDELSPIDGQHIRLQSDGI